MAGELSSPLHGAMEEYSHCEERSDVAIRIPSETERSRPSPTVVGELSSPLHGAMEEYSQCEERSRGGNP